MIITPTPQLVDCPAADDHCDAVLFESKGKLVTQISVEANLKA